MAKATKVPADYEVTLTMSRAEAETLLYVTGFIAGDTKTTPRKHMEEIRSVLTQAGVARPMLGASGDIHFERVSQ